MISKQEIMKGYVFLIEKNNDISSDCLEFIKDAALEKLLFLERTNIAKLQKENKQLNGYLEEINEVMYNTLLLKTYVFNRDNFIKKIMDILSDWAEATN